MAFPGRSATLEFGREQQQRERLRAVGGALDLARASRRRAAGPRLSRGEARGRRRCGRRGRRCGSPTRPASRPRRGRASLRRDRSSRPARAPPSPAGRGRTRRRAALTVGPLEHALAGREQARRRDDELLRRLQLGRRRAPGRLVLDQLAVELAELAVALQVDRRQPLDQRRRRLVGDEVARQLGGDEAGRRRMAGEVVRAAACSASGPSA